MIRDKLGVRCKHTAVGDEHVSTMSTRAATSLLDTLPEIERSVEATIYFGSSIKDYELWSCAVAIQHALRLDGGIAFELSSNCAGFGVGLYLARALILSDSVPERVLLVGASHESSVVDYTDIASKSVFAFGDGAAAVMVAEAPGGLRIIGTSLLSDGTYNQAVKVPGGGTVMPATPSSVDQGLHRVRVAPGLKLNDTVGPQFVTNMVEVGRRALAAANIQPPRLDVILIQHQIPSVYRAIMEGVGAPQAATVYLDSFGHMSSVDLPVALYLAAHRGLLPRGAYALLLSAGLGYTWSATVLRADSEIVLAGDLRE